jgi:hypothetical protein
LKITKQNLIAIRKKNPNSKKRDKVEIEDEAIMDENENEENMPIEN